MPHDVIMPALGMAQDTGLLVAWRKQPGEAVATGDVLFEVETDKATMEVEAQGDGFLADVRAMAGQAVPVGQVIARIATAPPAADAPAAAPAAATDALPRGAAVIMPALGMAQDSGLLVRWLKAPGDPVRADDPLFEVETDKTTVEVGAGHDGFVAATLAGEGDAVPVGQTIAIISAERPDRPVARAAGAAPAPRPVAPPPAPPASPAPSPAPAAGPASAPAAGGRILASPKARRLALEQGLDLGRLAAAGHPQPYLARDIDVLRALPDAAAAPVAASARRLTAEVAPDGFAAFADWAAQETGVDDSDALLAGLAGASLGRRETVVSVRTFDRDRLFAADGIAARARAIDAGTPDLVVRDLRFSRIATLSLGPENRPVLTLTAGAAGLSVTLECAADQLAAPQAIALLSEFAGRMEQPLRHLL